MDTFPFIKPSYTYTKEIEYKTITSNFENGCEQRRNKWSQGKLHFTLVYNAITTTQMSSIWEFYVDKKGSYEAFTFPDFDTTSNSYTVKFQEDNLSYDAFCARLRRTGMKLIQVL